MRTTAPRARLVGGAAAAIGLTSVLVAGPAQATGTATVNVVHGIPGVTVKVCVDGRSVADDVRFGAKIVGAKLSAGSHNVRVVAAGQPCRSTAILHAAYPLRAGRNYTIVANLDPAGAPNLKAFRNPVRPTRAGHARLTVRHTAQAPAVNVWAGCTRLIGGTSFRWGSSRTFGVPAGHYRVRVTLPGSWVAVIGPATKHLHAGRAYQVYAVGSPGHYRLVTVAVPVGTR
jgi:hypothetical protein